MEATAQPQTPTTTSPGLDDNQNIVEDLCMEYSQHLSVNSEKEQKQLDDNIEDLLTKLEEYCGLVDIIRSDTTLCLTRTLPQVYGKSKEMEAIYNRIDQLEAFVATVKGNVTTMEALLDQSESEMGSYSGMKKFLSSITMPSFLGKKLSQPKPERQLSQFTPPEIFKTEDFFPDVKIE